MKIAVGTNYATRLNGLFIMRKLLIIIILFFPLMMFAQTSPIVISEIGAFEKSENEWVEIYNRSKETVNIEGWRFVEGFTSTKEQGSSHQLSIYQGDFIIEPQEYAIIANKAEQFKENNPDFLGTIIDSSWSSLKEKGERIEIRDSAGTVLEGFEYLPAQGASLQRINLEAFDYTGANWKEHVFLHSAGYANVFEKGNKIAEVLPAIKPEESAQTEQVFEIGIVPADFHIKNAVQAHYAWNRILYQAMPDLLPQNKENSAVFRISAVSILITFVIMVVVLILPKRFDF